MHRKYLCTVDFKKRLSTQTQLIKTVCTVHTKKKGKVNILILK